jgi:hypothetical protein
MENLEKEVRRMDERIPIIKDVVEANNLQLRTANETLIEMRNVLKKMDERQQKMYFILSRYGGAFLGVTILSTVVLKTLGIDIEGVLQ